MLAKARTHWFIIALIFVLTIGYWQANRLAWISELTWLRTSIVAIVMFAMALPIPLRQVGQSLRKPWPSFLAIVLNMGALPLLAWFLSRFLEPSMAGGLIVAAVVPCTLASAAVWTRRAGGDDTIAILVTLVTSSTCFLVAPLWLGWLLAQSVKMDGWVAASDLALTVLLPMVLAQIVTLQPRIATFAKNYKLQISLFCQIGILSMVSIGAIQIGLRTSGGDSNSPWLSFMAVMIVTVTLHLVILGAGWWLARLFGMDRSSQIAVALAGSQKTLMIGLKLAVDCGVSVVPMVVYHVGQLVIDAALVEKWRKDSPKP